MAIKRADFPLPDVEDPLTAEFFAARGPPRALDPALRQRATGGSGIPSRSARAAAAS